MVTDAQIRVLVIGAGTAGIAAANHLRNYGHNVSPHTLTTHPPAGEDPGGEWVSRREGHNFSLGPCVGMGAMFITGTHTLVAEHRGFP